MSRETTIVVVELVKVETAKAFLMEIDGKDYWIPKSQVEDADAIGEGFSGDVEITTWIAGEKNLL